MLFACFPPIAGGQTAQILVTLNNNASADIEITPGIWEPTAGISSDENTGTSGYFTIYNNGSLTVDIYINGEDSEDWTLETSEGHNNFALKYRKTDEGIWTSIVTSSNLFINDFTYNTNKDFDLWLYMPTSTSTNNAQATNMTVTIQPA